MVTEVYDETGETRVRVFVSYVKERVFLYQGQKSVIEGYREGRNMTLS